MATGTGCRVKNYAEAESDGAFALVRHLHRLDRLISRRREMIEVSEGMARAPGMAAL